MMRNKQMGGMWPFSSAEESYNSYNINEVSSPGVTQYLFYILVLIIVMMLILVLVHFTIRPIFRVKPGDKGIIPIPGSNDEALYWKDVNKLNTLPDGDTPLKSQYENWSMILDIQVDNPMANTNRPRVLFTRGGPPTTNVTTFAENDTIVKLNPLFNAMIYLDRLTNDLYVTVQTRETNTPMQTLGLESCVIPNVPVGKSIRLGVMVGSHILEVYVNGYLAKSKAFSSSISAVAGSCQPPDDDILSRVARVRNLRLWNRILSPAEFRSYGRPDDFSRKELPDSCVS